MKYTKQDCIDAIRRAAEEQGRPLKRSEYRDGRYSPCTTTIKKKFGSWNEAKEAAGLEALDPNDFRTPRTGCRFLTNQYGYEVWQTSVSRNRLTVQVHRLIAVAEHGFDEVAGNVVHHKNGCKFDNRPENLEVMSRGDHMSHHRQRGDIGPTGGEPTA